MNTPQRLIDRFVVFSGEGKVQPDKATGILDEDLDTRDACTIAMEEVISRREIRDCRGRDLIDEKIRTRMLRFTFTYSEVTPQIIARWAAYFLGASSEPAGTRANETQTFTGTPAAPFTLTYDLEGFSVTTKPIPPTVTAAEFAVALTEAQMEFIQPGDVQVAGTLSGGFTVTYIGRLAGTDMPLPVSSDPAVAVAAGTAGSQKLADLTRSVSDIKQRLSFALGWEDITDRTEKYVGYVVESLSPSLNRRQPVGLTVVVIGPWAPEILTDFDAPECVNIDALMADDCRVEINGAWETPFLNTETYSIADNVPTDEIAAFPFAGIDVSNLQRGDQPSYDISAGIFASEKDDVYQLALNERTQAPVDYRTHFGMPGNRITLVSEATKIKFQTSRMTQAGALNESVVQITGTPYKDGVDPPLSAEARLDQDAAFLVTSE